MVVSYDQMVEGELSNLLSAYLVGWRNLMDCAEWFSGINWEELDVDSPLAATLGELDLLCTEAREGLRPESDFERKASDMVAARSCFRYSVARSAITTYGSSTNVGVVVPELPFWSRSPQEAPV